MGVAGLPPGGGRLTARRATVPPSRHPMGGASSAVALGGGLQILAVFARRSMAWGVTRVAENRSPTGQRREALRQTIPAKAGRSRRVQAPALSGGNLAVPVPHARLRHHSCLQALSTASPCTSSRHAAQPRFTTQRIDSPDRLYRVPRTTTLNPRYEYRNLGRSPSRGEPATARADRRFAREGRRRPCRDRRGAARAP